ncbi:hypothetical protein [Saccharibacillus kuerlensis]|uniref:Peptidase M10 metallopeptidase domain-containing protein n=1 Tax=Saccharibacillus kuerlensis TaxID=459527 RepID=A0ABQ2LDJ9_9BACL|nr:hypothetical protein [Saccharibacillus kuerlensis]GGO09367.1 hypothetical protein GCM10010969_39740 [Saccharibacillus kuerlensis]
MNSLGFKGSVQNGVKQWDNASTGVFITEVVNSSTASMKIYAGKGNLPPGTYGAATYWMLSGRNITPDEVTNGTNFQQGVIRFDLDNQNAAGFENVHRYKTSGHEIGHVLGLNHFEEPPGHSGNHWMKSGKIALEQSTSVDLAHLRTKWGW